MRNYNIPLSSNVPLLSFVRFNLDSNKNDHHLWVHTFIFFLLSSCTMVWLNQTVCQIYNTCRLYIKERVSSFRRTPKLEWIRILWNYIPYMFHLIFCRLLIQDWRNHCGNLRVQKISKNLLMLQWCDAQHTILLMFTLHLDLTQP